MQETVWDVVVIGAGMSGLGAGLRLALAGKKVLIVEQHNVIGGLNSFYLKDGIKYDVGLHALTNYVKAGTKGNDFRKCPAVVTESNPATATLYGKVGRIRDSGKMYLVAPFFHTERTLIKHCNAR